MPIHQTYVGYLCKPDSGAGFTKQRARIPDLNKVTIWPGRFHQENDKTVHLEGSVGEVITGY